MFQPRSTVVRRIAVCLVLLTSLVTSACGSRVGRARLEATIGSLRISATPGKPGQPAAAGTAARDPAALAPAQPLASGSRASADPGDRSGAIAPDAASQAAPLAGGRSAAPTRAVPGAQSAGPVGSPGGQPSPSAGPAGSPAAPGSGVTSKSEILLGSFGTESGILGTISGSAPPAIRAWVADVNSRGGLSGHPVRVLLADDGADPARTQAIVKKMVEQDHVVAFFYHYAFSLQSVYQYLESKGVPLIGGIGTDPVEDHSSVIFEPLVGADTGIGWSLILAITAQTNKRNLGFIYCREVAGCSLLFENAKSKLPYDGLHLVYQAQASLAQPDYTAEMLSAQRAGADVIIVILDTSATGRVATAAKRQGYSPVFAGAYNLETPQALVLPELDGLLMPSRQGAYDTSPRTQPYRDAMARYQPNAPRGGLGAGVFMVGKLLEKVAPLLGDTPGPSDFVRVMHALRGERLGGLLPGISFADGNDHTSTNQCIIPIRVAGGRYVPHDPTEAFVCAPGWKPAA
jgi:branched-chain amino acid transport system substrate-binding protein